MPTVSDVVTSAADPVPTGFTPHASGLVVPADVARIREVWTNDERKQLARALGLCDQRQVLVGLKCGRPGCPDPMLRRVETPEGFSLRCGCVDRVIRRRV